MKIGILTFHCAHNYGAVLQCYALLQYLRSLGHEALIVNYRPEYLLKPYTIVPDLGNTSLVGKIKILLNFILSFPVRVIRYKGFEKFIDKYLLLSKVVDRASIDSLACNIYIIGSDQVRNPKITEGFDDVYWGNFVVRKNVKKITYAVSIGLSNLT